MSDFERTTRLSIVTAIIPVASRVELLDPNRLIDRATKLEKYVLGVKDEPETPDIVPTLPPKRGKRKKLMGN